MNKYLYSILVFLVSVTQLSCESMALPEGRETFLVMAYYSGNETAIDQYDVGGLTHIIFSFCHLDGNRIIIPENRIPVVKKLVSLKDDHPGLKIILALGGWGGCETCSEVFSSPEGRSEFAVSVREMLEEYNADGIDLDWEYPAISGYPGHRYVPGDKQNFTLLVKKLRELLGTDYEIGFAAGGFKKFFDESVEWKKVMPVVDYVNIMTYDLVSAGSVVAGNVITGHHTPLYSINTNSYSVHFAVSYLDSIGVDPTKMVIGAAFYGRAFEGVPDINRGLSQPGRFKTAITYRNLDQWFEENNMKLYWDDEAAAPYAWSAEKGIFATFDNPRSVKLKTRFAIDNGLGGIMFWQLGGDKPDGGLLDAIYSELD